MVIFLLAALSQSSFAEGRKDVSGLTFGAEWAYAATFVSGHHYNFFAPEGYRENIKDASVSYFTNAEFLLNVGYDLGKFWNLSLYAGYAGAGSFEPVIPLSLRATRFFMSSHQDDRWMAFVDVGSGMNIKKRPQAIFTGKLGGGYRIALSQVVNLDFLVSLRLLYTHPDVVYYDEYIDAGQINRNDGYIASLNIGIALTF